jgi:hypothetical protein
MSSPERPMGRNVKSVHVTNGPEDPIPVTPLPGPGGAIPVKGSPGTTITSSPVTAVGALATVPLPVAPAGTRRMRVQNVGSPGSVLRVREVGGPAGAGFLCVFTGPVEYGGADGALAALEVEETAGVATAAMIQFEGD